MIFGEYSPAGRLPITFYKTLEELPEFTDYSMKGRTYRYMEHDALYPFGYGLSYTSFAYESLGEPEWQEDSLHFQVRVTNTGDMDADEVVQLYTIHKSLPIVPCAALSVCGSPRVSLRRSSLY